MIDLSIYTNSTIAVPSFVLQARDWKTIYMRIIGLEDFDNVAYELQSLFRVQTPPANTDNVTVTTLTIGLIARIYEWNYPCGPLPTAGKNRLKAALTALGNPLAQLVIDKDANINESEQSIQTKGNKRLRGV